MRYVHIAGSDEVVTYIYTILHQVLTVGQNVTWLVSGGSAIPLEVEISKRLQQDDISRLRVILTDERYGKPGHSGENWWQLEQAGFSLPGATTYRILHENLDREATTKQFAATLEQFFKESDTIFGLFGMGPDGHTAGIKPHAFDMDTPLFAVGYTGEDFERITMTPHAVEQVTNAILYASGEAKRPALQTLLEKELPTADQPAQLLKHLPVCTLFTDLQIKEEKS